MGVPEIVNPIRELLLYYTSKWLVYFWGDPEFARTIPIRTLERLQAKFHGDDLEIIHTPSGAILVVLKTAEEDLPHAEVLIRREVFREIIREFFEQET